jgi:FecR protein
MRRRSSFRYRLDRIRSPRPLGRLLVLSAALALLLSALTVFGQDTPPPPPPDQQAANTASPPEQSNVRAVRLSDVEGQVQVFQGDQQAFNQAEPNMPAVEGMRFVTGDNGRLEIEFEDGSVARVTPNSSIRLTQLHRTSDGNTVTQIDALSGLTYYELNGHAGEISVHFDSDTATPVDSGVFRISLDAAPNELSVMHGAVHVDDGQGVSLDVHPNQTFQTDPQQPGEFTVAQNVTADSWDQWNSDRDQALSAMESNETTARATSGEPDNPAWNDLDYYGNWYNLPGYGQVWSPAGVGADWDPFGSGYWGYYPAFGYTWISGYPWGWWPFHCGAWDFVDAWGWMWVPGNCGWGFYGAGWFPYASVWRVPRGYVPPPRPHPGPHPHPLPLIAINRGAFPFHSWFPPRAAAAGLRRQVDRAHGGQHSSHPARSAG